MRAVAVVLLLTPHCVHAVGPAVDLNVPYAHSVDPRMSAHLARIRRNAHVEVVQKAWRRYQCRRRSPGTTPSGRCCRWKHTLQSTSQCSPRGRHPWRWLQRVWSASQR